jgi:hypothetical protein
MTVFRDAVDATFAAFGIDAIYTPAGGEPVPVRVIARRPDTIVGFGETRIHAETATFEVRASEVANPRSNDQLQVSGETFVVQGEPQRSRRGRFLAIPTENAPRRGTDGKRINPSTFPEHRFGPLRFVPRPSGISLLVVARGRGARRRAGELRFPRRKERCRRADAHSYADQRPRRNRLCMMLPEFGVGYSRLIHRSLLKFIPGSVDECDGRMPFSLSLGVPRDRHSVGAERERRTPQSVRPERSSGSAGSPPSPTAARSGPPIARRKRAGAARRRIPADPARCRAPRTVR